MRLLFSCVLSFLFIFPAYAGQHKPLSDDDIQRVKAFKELTREVEQKSVSQLTREIEASNHPQLTIELKEAIAKTYVDIVREQNVQGLKRKQWLYSMVALNMAYLQFAGVKAAKDAQPLNTLIRRSLRDHLPQDIEQRPGFFHSIE